jgi:hypothetical protein
MSTNEKDQRSREMRDPSKDEYLELEKRLGRVEYELAADITAGNKALGDAVEAAREHTKSAIGDIRPSRGDGRG